MGLDKIIDNGALVLENGCLDASLAIKDGKIAVILQDDCGANEKERINVGERYIFSGGADTYAYFSDPGTEHRGGWECGTKAAASGGYTPVMEIPDNSLPIIDRDTFRTKYERTSQYAVTNFALWGGATTGGNSHVRELCDLEYIAFKGFTLDAELEFK